MSALDDVTSIVRADGRGGVRLIGVDGPSGSGKSTFARRLAEVIGAPRVEIDDFVAWDDFSGWWPRFEREVLRPLLAGSDARYQVRDWEGDPYGRALGPWKTVAWHPLMVIEGVTCTRRASTDLLSCRVWVEVPAELRLRRGMERDGEDHRPLWKRWMAEEEAFFRDDDTRARADVVVDGTAPIG
jgi:uridine kinase